MENRVSENVKNLEFESKTKYTDMARKFMVLFIIQIFLLCINIARDILIKLNSTGPDFKFISDITNLVIDIIYTAFLFSLTKYDSRFAFAGIFGILSIPLDYFIIPFLAYASSIFKVTIILSYIFSYLWLLNFTNAMSSLFLPVNGSLSNLWNTFRKISLIAILLGYVIFSFFPIKNNLTTIISTLFYIANLCLSIWRLYLLHKSSTIMKAFANEPVESPADSHI